MRNDIEQIIKDHKINTLGFKQSFKGIEKYINDKEVVKYISRCNCRLDPNKDMVVDGYKVKTALKEKKPYLFAVTDKKVILYWKIMFDDTVKIIDIEKIQAWNMKKNLMGSTLRIETITELFDIDLNCKPQTIEIIAKLLAN